MVRHDADIPSLTLKFHVTYNMYIMNLDRNCNSLI